ncbi:peptide alpha-N-acetyltransferase [Cryptococcus neoformans Tu401-1]|nr:peptide alpha-N-acetyltransferase [Cryptococcus neoformans var. grubii Tu401-1]OXM76999.1 peptide alpha-N-acetyltransferase [Cryptococcus neoformans var. grubii Bt63]
MISATHGIESLQNTGGAPSTPHALSLASRDIEPPPPIPPRHGSPASANSMIKEPTPSRSIPSQSKGKEREIPELPTETIKDGRGEELFYRTFRGEEYDLENIMKLVEEELSEPYNVYTYRYFLFDWPHLTFLVFPSPTSTRAIATIICKQDMHRGNNRGYIGMLSVAKEYRRRGIGRKLVEIAVKEMAKRGAKQVMLETEYDNETSLALYDKLGFLREKRLHRFYSNEKDAFRLILPIDTEDEDDEVLSEQLERTGPGLGHIDEEDEMSPYFT